jgi:hypothetical protein
MKRLRLLLPAAALLALLALLAAGRWATPRPAGFDTPEECVVAHAEACKAGDAAAYLACLTGPLLDEARRQDEAGELPAVLGRSLLGVKSWVLVAPAAVEGDSATVEVDLARTEDARRTRFRLRRTGAGWRIAGIGGPRDVPLPVRPGTHVSQE